MLPGVKLLKRINGIKSRNPEAVEMRQPQRNGYNMITKKDIKLNTQIKKL